MISIKDKNQCCGCSACVQACPKQCISFDEDEQGFRYPLVNRDICVDCKLCEKVCPSLNQNNSKQPLNVYAAINPNEEIRMQSSSGGIFTMLAEVILAEGGVVFGACFDHNWEVRHDYVENKQELSKFRGSKYVQSRIGESFKQAKVFLNQGRKVLFSGTSCQIAGLKLFLRKEYENLITIDVVCHGVPSPKIWRDYIEFITRPQGVDGKNTVLYSLKAKPVITGVSFRDKTNGWKKFGFELRGKVAYGDKNSVLNSDTNQSQILLHESVNQNLYMQGFINNLFIRPSCFHCPSKEGRCNSDFSLADFWAIKLYAKQLDDDKGVTLLYVHSKKALQLLYKINANLVELDKDKDLNIAFSKATKEKYPIDDFWKRYSLRGLDSIREICKEIKPSALCKFRNRLYSFVKRKLS